MKTVPLWNVGLSLIGLLALVEALAQFPSLVTWGTVLVQYERGRGLVPIVTILPFVLLVLVGIILAAHPAAVARLLWPGTTEEHSPPIPEEPSVLLLAAVGVLIFAGALPELFQAALFVMMADTREQVRLQLLGAAVARAVLGLVLFFRPRLILEFWRRKQPPPATDATSRGAA